MSDYPDPLVRTPSGSHPIEWWYGGRLMGYLTREAIEQRRARFARNGGSDPQTTLLDLDDERREVIDDAAAI